MSVNTIEVLYIQKTTENWDFSRKYCDIYTIYFALFSIKIGAAGTYNKAPVRAFPMRTHEGSQNGEQIKNNPRSHQNLSLTDLLQLSHQMTVKPILWIHLKITYIIIPVTCHEQTCLLFYFSDRLAQKQKLATCICYGLDPVQKKKTK